LCSACFCKDVLLLLLLLLPADPLRVMRAVRFATRFNFAPDPAILTAAASEEVSNVRHR
jgi:tRNA nucleotidyltransferase/poly(A) polymerase